MSQPLIRRSILTPARAWVGAALSFIPTVVERVEGWPLIAGYYDRTSILSSAGPNPAKVMSVHFPKAAGTSLHIQLGKLLWDELALDYTHDQLTSMGKESAEFPSCERIVHGHFRARNDTSILEFADPLLTQKAPTNYDPGQISVGFILSLIAGRAMFCPCQSVTGRSSATRAAWH
jgi:hypothetical protein